MKNLIVKANSLIESSHKLNEVEQRIILLAILKARENKNSIDELKGKKLLLHASDYVNYFGTSSQNAYEVLRKGVVSLFNQKWGYRYINNKGSLVVGYERFTQNAEYIEGEGFISFVFADSIIPMLVELEKNFTSYQIEQVATLKSRYSMRLYEFFMQFLDKKNGSGYLAISLEDLRFRLGLEQSEYSLMSNFKKFVLNSSLDEINEKTDLIVTYTQKKRGRTIIGFTFKFEQKNREKIVAGDKCDKKYHALSLKAAKYFGSQLANNAEFGSEFAQMGELQTDFVSRIQEELLDKSKVEKYWRWLLKVGYNSTNTL